MKNLSKTLGINNIILVILLCATFINWQGYWYLFAVLPIAYAVCYKKAFRSCDKALIIILLFVFSYIAFSEPLSLNSYATFLLIYPMLYLVGKYIGLTEDDNAIINIIFFVAMSMAAMYVYSITKDIISSGFYSDSRNIGIEGQGGVEEVSATGIYSHLMLLTTFIGTLFFKLPYKKRIIFTTFAIWAFIISIRIQSRSSVILLSIAIILSILINFRNMNKRSLATVVISLGLILFSANYVLTNFEEELGILERFQDDDVSSGGQRTELAMNVIYELSENPWGGLEHMQYAHNMWIDCARVAGLVPLFFLLIITVLYIRSLWYIYKQKEYSSSSRDMILIIGVSLLVYMNVEPILEGSPLLFAFFILLLGAMRGRNALYK